MDEDAPPYKRARTSGDMPDEKAHPAFADGDCEKMWDNFTDEDKNDILENVKNGTSTDNIKIRHGITDRFLSWIEQLAKNGARKSVDFEKIWEKVEDKDDILEDIKKGNTTDKIKRRYGITDDGFLSWIEQLAKNPDVFFEDKWRKFPDDDKEDVMTDLANDKPLDIIKRKYRTTDQAFLVWLQHRAKHPDDMFEQKLKAMKEADREDLLEDIGKGKSIDTLTRRHNIADKAFLTWLQARSSSIPTSTPANFEAMWKAMPDADKPDIRHDLLAFKQRSCHLIKVVAPNKG